MTNLPAADPRPETEDEPDQPARSTRFWVMFGLAAAIMLGAGGYGAYRLAGRFMEGRNLVRARSLAAEGDLRRAQLLLEQAVQVNPRSLRAQRAFAEFLDTIGSPLAWARWREAVALAPWDDDLRLKLAASALRAGEHDEVRTALATVSDPGRETVAFHRTAAGFALAENRAVDLARHYAALVRLEPANERFQLNLAAFRLRSSDRAVKEQARRELDRLARGAKVRIRAVLELIGDAPQRWPAGSDPGARLAEHIFLGVDSLSLAPAQYENAGPPQLVAYMMAQPSPEPQDVATLAAWLVTKRHALTVLQWLDTLEPGLRQNRLVLVAMADAAASAGRWDRLQACLLRGAWGLAPPGLVQAAFALHRKPAGERKPGDWNALLDQAQGGRGGLRMLWRLAQAWQWGPEADRTLRAITRLHPDEQWAWETLLTRLLEAKSTAELWQLYERWAQAAPGDRQILMERAILAGVLGRTTPEMQRRVEQARAGDPSEPGWAVAHALMLRQQGRGDEGLKLLSEVSLSHATEPRYALVHGVFLAEAGRAAESEKLLGSVPVADLLPEEQALLDAARARNRGALARR